jgi:hypothetical protein
VTIAKRLVCPSAELGKPLSRNDLKQMIREGKVHRPHIALTEQPNIHSLLCIPFCVCFVWLCACLRLGLMGLALGCWLHVPQRLPLSYAGDILKQAAAMSRPPSTQQLDEEKKRLKAALLSPSSDTAMVHHSPIGRYAIFTRVVRITQRG